MTTELWNGKESIVCRPKPVSSLLVMLQCAPNPVRDAPLESAVMTPIILSQTYVSASSEPTETYRASTAKREEKPTADNRVPVFKSGLYGRSQFD